MPEYDDVSTFELAPGHVLTGRTPIGETVGLFLPGDIPPRLSVLGPTRYSCSCGEISDVATDVAQDHAEDVTP